MDGGWVVLLDTTPPTVAVGKLPTKKLHSNVSQLSEWRALSVGLDWLKYFKGLTHLKIRGDCMSVVKPLSSQQAPKPPFKDFYCQTLVKLKQMGMPWDAKHIPRDLNLMSHRVAKGHSFPRITWDVKVFTQSLRHHATSMIAKSLWAQAGCPQGRDEEIWFTAEDLLLSAMGKPC